MTENVEYSVALFQSVSAAMKAESVLKAAGAPYKIIPVPKSISSECGICVRFLSDNSSAVAALLAEANISFSLQDL